MKDLKQQIEELKERLAVLESMVDMVEPQITKDYGKFVPEYSHEFFYIQENGVIDSYINTHSETDRDAIDAHNAFPTKELAEAEAKYTLISRQYRNFARKLNGDWKPDWASQYENKWGVVLDEGESEVMSFTSLNYAIHQVIFKRKAHAELALEVFGDDLLVLCS